jgi:pimeloyl-ACP methyl ester carboxylesterase
VGIVTADQNARTIFYNDVDEDLTNLLLPSLVKVSFAAKKTALKHAASEIVVPKLYIAATLDKAIPHAAQMAWAQASGARIVELECGHSPFAIREQIPVVTKLIGEIVQGC